MNLFPGLTVLLLYLLPHTLAASSDGWKGRSIYRVIVDRFALPNGADATACNPGQNTWCGGTWNTIRENLDYIQHAGFTAMWISPVSQNYEGPTTPHGDPYHGYWIADATQINQRFGTSDDLKSLSRELHDRGMYLMVEVVVNDVMATSITPDLSTYMFKDESQYHPYCALDWNNATSRERCWLGDTAVPLVDINTEDPTVISFFQEWIQSLVNEYSIDGLYIDAVRNVNAEFWTGFRSAAGVFCIGDASALEIDEVATYQGTNGLDSVLNYPIYGALVDAFAMPGPQNMSSLTDAISQSKQKFHDVGLLGNFVETPNIARWRNFSDDLQTLFNAMVFNFMTDGIPIVYYGQEQDFNGGEDPWNREPLWKSGYTNTSTYHLISTLNQFRNFLVKNGTWLDSPMHVLTSTNEGLIVMKGVVISAMTNIGSSTNGTVDVFTYTTYAPQTPLIDVLTCAQWQVGSNGTVNFQYSQTGGVPVVLIPVRDLDGSGLCAHANVPITASNTTPVRTSGELPRSARRRQPWVGFQLSLQLLLVLVLVDLLLFW